MKQPRRCLGFVRPFAIVIMIAAIVAGCGGGSSSGGGGGGPDGDGSGRGPAPPAVIYTGASSAAVLDEANAAHFTANLIDGLVLVEGLSQAIVREPDLVRGPISETISGAQGGSVRVTGYVASNGTGWFQLDYNGFAEDGVTLNGREVQTILAPRTSSSGHVRLSYHGMRWQTADSQVEFTGSLTRRESGHSPAIHATDIDMIVRNLDTGELRRLGPWQYDMRFDISAGGYRIPAFAAPVYSAEFGVAMATLQEPLDFGRDMPMVDTGTLEITAGPHRGKVNFSGANDTSFQLVGLNRFFGALLFTASDGRVSTLRLAWDEEYDQVLPGAGVVSAAAGPLYRGELDRRVDLEGRMAEHSGAQSIRHEWRFVAVPPGSEVELQEPQSPTPWFIPDRFGTYLVEQLVTRGAQEHRDYARVLVLDWRPDFVHDTFIPNEAPNGGADQRVDLGASLTIDARRSGAGLALQQRFISWSLPDALGGAYAEGPVITALAQQRGGHAASLNVYVPGRGDEWAEYNVFVDTPFWNHRPLLLADDDGVLFRPTDAAFTDYDGNGEMDLVVSRWIPLRGDSMEGQAGAMLTVIPVNGSGNLGTPRHFALPSAGAIAVADLNSDGRKDVVLRGGGQIAIFYQQADHQLHPGPVFNIGSCRWLPDEHGGLVHIGDVTGNGRADIVAAGNCEDGPEPVNNAVVTLVQDGAGNFTLVATSIGSGLLETLTAGDLNGNGLMDIAMRYGSFSTGGLQIGYAQADGRFALEQVPLSGPIGAPLVSDLNGDGRDDVAILAGVAVELFFARSEGGFDRQSDAAGSVLPGDRVFSADLDHDGRRDLLLVNEYTDGGGPRIHTMMQNSQGRFEGRFPMPFFSSPAYPGTRLLAVDLDGDGRDDIVAVRVSYRSLIHRATLEISMRRP